jgi:uncharacterized repeat protein (TIGR03843 family)
MTAALHEGKLELKGRFMLGSNHTFLVGVQHANLEIPAVYKPARGEQPLWDFPAATLASREVAAYIVSETLGFHFVPCTVLREEGPYGPGSLQQFIEYDPEYHYFTFTPADRARLDSVVLFDLLVNNADRKGSHVLIEKETDKLWAIDHGICFHSENKLRTVLWDFAGKPIPDEWIDRLSAHRELRTLLKNYLSREEIEAFTGRAETLIKKSRFPNPPQDRRATPWPPI